MSLTERIQTKTTKEGKLIVSYSSPGVGKTSMWAQAKDSILIEVKDNSASALKDIGAIREDLPVVSTTDWHDTLAVLRELVETGSSFRHVIIDGISGADEFCDELTIKDDCEGDADKFLAFGRGEGLSSVKWMELVQLLRDLKAKGLWIYLLGHSQITTVNNPSGANFSRYSPACGKKKLAQILKFSDAILYSTFITAITDVNKQSGTGKALGGERRVMYTSPSASYESKNRLNLPSVIELGNSAEESFNAFVNAVKAGRKKA
jgi:hypothetical protein